MVELALKVERLRSLSFGNPEGAKMEPMNRFGEGGTCQLFELLKGKNLEELSLPLGSRLKGEEEASLIDFLAYTPLKRLNCGSWHPQKSHALYSALAGEESARPPNFTLELFISGGKEVKVERYSPFFLRNRLLNAASEKLEALENEALPPAIVHFTKDQLTHIQGAMRDIAEARSLATEGSREILPSLSVSF